MKDLAAAINALIAYDQREIQLYDRKGYSAVSKTDTTGDSRRLFGNARDILQTFSREEQKLLGLREISEQADYQSITRLLVLGSVLAAVLLILSHQMATHELRQRRRAELKLSEITRLQDAILNSANYAIIALDSRGVVQTFNPAAERMLGYSAAEVIAKTTPMLWRDPQEVAAQAEKLSRELGRPVKADVEILTARTFKDGATEFEVTYIRKDGSRFPVLVSLTTLGGETDAAAGFLGVIADITDRKKSEALREQLINELKQALHEVKTLSGMIPICGWCKSVRTDQGFWQTVEDYVRTRADVTFSHGMCPKCSEKFKEDITGANKKQ